MFKSISCFFFHLGLVPNAPNSVCYCKKHAFMAMHGYLHFQTNIRGMEFERDTGWYLLVMYFGWNPPKT